MKTITIMTILILSLFLASCTTSKPMTEVEQAQHYGMSLQEFRETKDAAARMNMTIEDHMKMTESEKAWNWDMMNDNMMKNPIIEEDDDMMSH